MPNIREVSAYLRRPATLYLAVLLFATLLGAAVLNSLLAPLQTPQNRTAFSVSLLSGQTLRKQRELFSALTVSGQASLQAPPLWNLTIETSNPNSLVDQLNADPIRDIGSLHDTLYVRLDRDRNTFIYPVLGASTGLGSAIPIPDPDDNVVMSRDNIIAWDRRGDSVYYFHYSGSAEWTPLSPALPRGSSLRISPWALAVPVVVGTGLTVYTVSRTGISPPAPILPGRRPASVYATGDSIWLIARGSSRGSRWTTHVRARTPASAPWIQVASSTVELENVLPTRNGIYALRAQPIFGGDEHVTVFRLDRARRSWSPLSRQPELATAGYLGEAPNGALHVVGEAIESVPLGLLPNDEPFDPGLQSRTIVATLRPDGQWTTSRVDSILSNSAVLQQREMLYIAGATLGGPVVVCGSPPSAWTVVAYPALDWRSLSRRHLISLQLELNRSFIIVIASALVLLAFVGYVLIAARTRQPATPAQPATQRAGHGSADPPALPLRLLIQLADEANERMRATTQTANIMLVTGLIMAFVGLAVFFASTNLQNAGLRPDPMQFLFRLIGPGSVLLFIEGLAIFFLRMYRAIYSGAKYYYIARLTLMKLAALYPDENAEAEVGAAFRGALSAERFAFEIPDVRARIDPSLRATLADFLNKGRAGA